MTIFFPFSVNKKSLIGIALSVCLAPFNLHAKNVDNLLSSQSFTGVLLTPNAQVQDQGDIAFLYGQGVPYNNQIAELDNLLVNVGLFAGFEAGVRIVTKTYDCNGYTGQGSDCDGGGGIRDLSASLKYQFPFLYDYTGVNFALGVQDLGGAANNFETFYGVADYEFDFYPIRMSVGYAKSKLSLNVMDGAFGSVEVQPLSFLQLATEYDAAKINAGIKLFTPEGFLPLDAQVAMQYQVYTGHDDEASNNQSVWSVDASVPLAGFSANDKKKESVEAALSESDIINIAQNQYKTAGIEDLKKALLEEGFLNVRVANNKETLFISFENRRYNHNQVDGLGVALGIISSYSNSEMLNELDISAENPNFEIYSLVNDLPVIAVSGSLRCYRRFIEGGSECDDLTFNQGSAQSNYAAVMWGDEIEASSFGRTQITLAPVISHRTATEYGVYDYSLALETNLYTTLWKGAALDLSHTLPISNSDDYEEGKIWDKSRHENQIVKALAHQAFMLPYGFATQFSAGYLSLYTTNYVNWKRNGYQDYYGGMNETTWTPGNGRNTFGFQLSQFESPDELDEDGNRTFNKVTQLANYQLNVPEWNWQFKVQGGQYSNADIGYNLTSSHWLGDVRLDASYLNSKANNPYVSDAQEEYEQFVKVNISVPLTFWRDMKPRYVQVKGTNEFNYSLQTRMGNTHNNLNTGLGNQINLSHGLVQQYQNRNRISQHYFEVNTLRLRNAYIRYIEDYK